MSSGQESRGSAAVWAAVLIIVAGFVVGGIGLIVGGWWLFYVGVAVVVVGGVTARLADIMSHVEEDGALAEPATR